MKAGILKEKITILYPNIVTSEYGENKQEWVAKYSTRAGVKIQSKDRTNENNEIFYSTSVEFKIRYYVNIDEFDRILYEGKQYRILSIIPDKNNQVKTLITELVNE